MHIKFTLKQPKELEEVYKELPAKLPIFKRHYERFRCITCLFFTDTDLSRSSYSSSLLLSFFQCRSTRFSKFKSSLLSHSA